MIGMISAPDIIHVTMKGMDRALTHGIATLLPEEVSEVLSKHPELEASRHVASIMAVVAQDLDSQAKLIDLLSAFAASERVARERVFSALLPDTALPPAPVLEQLRRNAQLVTDMAEEFGLLSSAEVAQMARSRAQNRAALASRWRSEGRVVGFEVNGTVRYPGFQFHHGHPRAEVGRVLRVLRQPLGNDQSLAMWFIGDNDWLGGLRPVDALDSDPDAVVGAAQRLADEILA